MSDKSNKLSKSGDGKANGKPNKSFLARIEQGLYDFYVTPYRRSFARAQRDEEEIGRAHV